MALFPLSRFLSLKHKALFPPELFSPVSAQGCWGLLRPETRYRHLCQAGDYSYSSWADSGMKEFSKILWRRHRRRRQLWINTQLLYILTLLIFILNISLSLSYKIYIRPCFSWLSGSYEADFWKWFQNVFKMFSFYSLNTMHCQGIERCVRSRPYVSLFHSPGIIRKMCCGWLQACFRHGRKMSCRGMKIMLRRDVPLKTGHVLILYYVRKSSLI